MNRVAHAAAFLAELAAAPAQAAVATLSATFSPVDQDTIFTVTNTSAVSETVQLATSLGTPTTVNLPNLAAGASERYEFNQQQGGFVVDPVSAGVPDSTTYALLIGLNAAPTLSSGSFSPLANATGGDVDFLGNNCSGFAGGAGFISGTCGGTDALSGIVAAVATPTAVPEPLSVSLMLVGMVGVGIAVRRRA